MSRRTVQNGSEGVEQWCSADKITHQGSSPRSLVVHVNGMMGPWQRPSVNTTDPYNVGSLDAGLENEWQKMTKYPGRQTERPIGIPSNLIRRMTRKPNITTLVGKHALKAMPRLFLVFSLTNGGTDCFSFYGNDNTMISGTQLEPFFSTEVVSCRIWT